MSPRMRSVRRATCTSADPESPGFRPNSPMIFCLVAVSSIYPFSRPVPVLPLSFLYNGQYTRRGRASVQIGNLDSSRRRRIRCMLKIGDTAPDFSGPLDDGTTFTLSEWIGKKNVALYFYIKDFTRG